MIAAYLSPRFEVTPGRTRNVLAQLVTFPESFEEVPNLTKGFGICIVTASQATHDAIAADGRAVLVSTIRADDSFDGGLDLTVGNLSGAQLTAAKNKMEAFALPSTWITGTHTFRDVLRFAFRTVFITQIMSGDGTAADVLAWINNNSLDATVNSVPVAARNRIRAWITGKGLDVSWIVGGTTVREVLAYIVNNLNWGIIAVANRLF